MHNCIYTSLQDLEEFVVVWGEVFVFGNLGFGGLKFAKPFTFSVTYPKTPLHLRHVLSIAL